MLFHKQYKDLRVGRNIKIIKSLKNLQSKGHEKKDIKNHNTLKGVIQRYMLLLWECKFESG